jgi:hypothetical protein
MRMGLSASLTGALRMAAMKAGHQAMRGHWNSIISPLKQLAFIALV